MTVVETATDVETETEPLEVLEVAATSEERVSPATARESFCTSRWGITDLIPWNDYPHIGGTVIAAMWERDIFSAMEHGTEGIRWYQMGVDGHGPYGPYFESDGEGDNLHHNWRMRTPEGEARYTAATFGPDTPNRFGLSRSFHLVELEVNGGRGGGADGIFVATNVRVLDGTPGYMSDPTGVLASAHARFAEIRRALGLDFAVDPETSLSWHQRLFITWYQLDRELTIVFVNSRNIGSAMVMESYQGDITCRGLQPRPVRLRHFLQWGVRFDVSAEGEFTTETIYLPT